jgi:hypothetical protein
MNCAGGVGEFEGGKKEVDKKMCGCLEKSKMCGCNDNKNLCGRQGKKKMKKVNSVRVLNK